MTAKEKLRTKVFQMTSAEQKALVKEICRICEKQYRKGYQHGFLDSKKGVVTETQVTNFRGDGILENYSKVVYPPHFKRREKPMDRISVELAMPDMEILNALFLQAEDED
jgi:hypothetical protein